MSPLVYAHAGHWLAQLVYVAPVLALVVAIAVSKLKEKRRTRPPDESA